MVQRPDLHNDDLAVRDRVLHGDRAAAEVLFERHVEALYEFVYYRAGSDVSSAEDIVQDTMLVAIDKLADFDGRSSLHTWLCGIAKNKLRQLRRKRRPLPIADLLVESDGEIEAILSRVEREPLPEAVLEARETEELVGATLSSLPPEYRDALVAKYVDGRTVPAMASESGRAVKAVESTLFRARRAFGRIFTLLARSRGGLP